MKGNDVAVVFDFPALDWKRVRGGGAEGREKRGALGKDGVVRILEVSPKWNEEDWCRKEHVGYIISGRLKLDFVHRDSVEVREGQGFWIPTGCAHKASCKLTTTMFVVG